MPVATMSSSRRSDPMSAAFHAALNCAGTAYAFVMYHYYNHKTEFVLGCVLTVCVTFAITEIVAHERASKFVDPQFHDWTAITSSMDLKLGQVDHWCLKGGDEKCRCDDPLTPSARGEAKGWAKAHQMNVKAIRHVLAMEAEAENFEEYEADAADGNAGSNENWWEAGNDFVDDWNGAAEEEALGQGAYYGGAYGTPEMEEYDLDVVFLGDSITERLTGRFAGKEDVFPDVARFFEKKYKKDLGGSFEGLALGIAGDTSPNLLYRLVHGEMPPDLNPRVWWVTIGTNDLLRTQCSEEITLMGILRILEEIVRQKPDAAIVVNSILPATRAKDGYLDTVGKRKNGKRANDSFWPSIAAVNKQLEKFASKHPRIKYFDATDAFVEKRGSNIFIDRTLYDKDGIHPNIAGYKMWDKLIAKKLDSLVAKKDEEEQEKHWQHEQAAAKAEKGGEGGNEDEPYYGYYDGDDYVTGDYDFLTDDLYWAGGDDDWLFAGQDGD
uniref:SGNH hydrolase-type esterase domain-containing protein n=1 Tax=Trieres chinensis TaxID=1514140 RepID=A0A7S1ZRL5_TRICV